MKKALVLALVVLLVIGSAAAAYAKSQKVTLIDAANDRSAGFVIFNNPDPADEDYNLTMLVSLKQGEPNVTYDVLVRIEEPGVNVSLWYDAGDLTTNRRGHGNLEFHNSFLSPGLYTVQAFVTSKFYTDPVEILLK